MAEIYNGATRVTIGGVELPNVTFTIERQDAESTNVLSFRDCGASVEVETQISREQFDRLLDAFRPRTFGASDATLAKRVLYGGRKGRRAMRRLIAKGFAGVLTIDDNSPVPCPPIRGTVPRAP